MSELNRVKQAVARGYRTRAAIAQAAGLTQTATGTYLSRLISQGLVESSESNIPEERSRRIKHYHMVGVRFLLQDIWRAPTPSQRKHSG